MKRMDQINVIPFIDVMLVLLAIVLTTATFIVEQRLPIRLPTAATKAQPENQEVVEIAIDQKGDVYFAGDALGSGESALSALAPLLEDLTKATPIRLRVDAAARFEAFVAVIDQIKAKGFGQVSILTLQP
jgi:biopolymer transport protein ExbD